VKKFYVFFLLLFVLFGTQESCIKSKSLADKIIIPTSVGPPQTFPKTYYVSETFNIQEFTILQKGIKAWERASNGIVKIKLVRWVSTEPFNKKYYYRYPKRTVWKISKEDKRVIELFHERKNEFSGLCSGNLILIVDEYAFNEKRLESIFVHEIGHSIGLKHIKKEYTAIMNSDLGNETITKWDLLQFCKFYNCRN
jgi:hypothetical protein